MGYHMSTNKGGEITPKLPIFKGMYYGGPILMGKYTRYLLILGHFQRQDNSSYSDRRGPCCSQLLSVFSSLSF